MHAARKAAGWLHVHRLATHCLRLTRKRAGVGGLKRDARFHLAPHRRAFADAPFDGLRALRDERIDVGFLAGHRRQPTGRPHPRPKGATHRCRRSYTPRNLPADAKRAEARALALI